MKQVNLSLETAKQMYFSENQALKAFALENYSKVELEKKKLPKTWEELDNYKGYYTDDCSKIIQHHGSEPNMNKNVFVTKEQAKASLRMAQLSQLMHVYNDGWVADWENTVTYKFTIEIFRECVYSSSYCETRRFLAFKTKQIRDEFAKNFKFLILEAKPLL